MIKQLSITFCLLFIFLFCSSCTTTPSATLTIPTPESKTGIVTGTIKDPQNNNLQINLFLSKNLTYDNPELPPTVAFSYQSDPRAILDENSGEFYFSNVEPGENYVITVWYPPGSKTYIREQSTNRLLLISVTSGSVTDVGIINLQNENE